jgi:hypothetical protein
MIDIRQKDLLAIAAWLRRVLEGISRENVFVTSMRNLGDLHGK